MNLQYFLENKNGSRLKPKSLKKENITLYNNILEYNVGNGFNDLPFNEQVWFYINRCDTKPECGVCGGETKFERVSTGYRSYCSVKCKSISKTVKDKTINTFNEKYGGHPMKNDTIKDKIKKTNMDRYGHESHLSSEIIKSKIESTNLIKYGVKRPLESKTIQDKSRNTMIDRHGVEHGLQSDDIHKKTTESLIKNNDWGVFYGKIQDTKKLLYGDKNYNNTEKNKETCLEKYGVNSVLKNPDIRNRIGDTKLRGSVSGYRFGGNIEIVSHDSDTCCVYCKVCGMETETPRHFMVMRGYRGNNMCLECNPKGKFNSENGLTHFITEEYVQNDRTVLDGLEIDILIPNKKMGIEYDGVYWHNELYVDKKYHLNKTELAKQKGYDLIHVFEDEWVNKEPIVKSIINNRLGNTLDRVYGRKCVIKEINPNVAKQFLIDNHIQGNVNSKIKLGLYHVNELVSVMTFGGNRVALGSKNREGEWEMLRFCNKLNTSVIGGASKLFKYFIKTYEPQKITTYADRRYFNGGLYENLGFMFLTNTTPNYHYVINGKRHHRYKFRKDVLVSDGYDKNKTEHQIMLERKIYRIYDCGNSKWEWVI